MPVSIGKTDYLEKMARLITEAPVFVQITKNGGACIILERNEIRIPYDELVNGYLVDESERQPETMMKGTRRRGRSIVEKARASRKESKPVIDKLASKYGVNKNALNFMLQRIMLWHECAHKLFTSVPDENIQAISERDFSFVNALEDCRIEAKFANDVFRASGDGFEIFNEIALSSVPENQFEQWRMWDIARYVIFQAGQIVHGLRPAPIADQYAPVVDATAQFMREIRARPGIAESVVKVRAIELSWMLQESKQSQTPPEKKRIGDGAGGKPTNEKPTDDDETGQAGNGQDGQESADDDENDAGETDDDENGESGQAGTESDETKDGNGQGPDSEHTGADGIGGNDSEFTSTGFEADKPDSRSLEERLKGMVKDVQQELKSAKIDLSQGRVNTNDPYALAEIKPEIYAPLVSRLRQIKATRGKKQKLDYDGENIDVPGLLEYRRTRIDTKMFESQSRASKPDYHISFAVDNSGSMGGHVDQGRKDKIARASVINLAYACEAVGMVTSIVGFENTAETIKAPDVKAQSANAEKIAGNGGNQIFEGVKGCLDHIRARPSERNAIIILSDGEDSTYTQTAQLMRQNPDVDFYFLAIGYPLEFAQAVERLAPDVRFKGKVTTNDGLSIPALLDKLVFQIVQNGQRGRL